MGGSSLFQNFGSQFAILSNESTDGKNSSRESLTDLTSTDQRSNKNYVGRYSGGGQNMNQYQNQNRNYNRQGSQGSTGGRNNRGSRSLHSPTANYNNKQFASRQNNSSRQNSYQGQQGGPSYSKTSDLPMKTVTLPRKLSADDSQSSTQMPVRQKIKEQDLITDPEKIQNGIMSMMTDYVEEKLTLNQVLDTIQNYKVTQAILLEVYNACLDRNEKARQGLTEIITESINQQLIELTDMKNALKEIFDLAADLLVDFPKLYEYIAQYISLPLYKGVIKMGDILTVAETEINAKNGHIVLKEIFGLVEKKYGQQNLCQICNNVDLKLFLIDKDLDEFLKEIVS